MYLLFCLHKMSLPQNKAEVKKCIFVQYKYKMDRYQVINHVIHRLYATKTRELTGYFGLRGQERPNVADRI